MYAQVLFQQKVGQESSCLTYKVPENLELKIGQAVKVPIRQKTANGIIWHITDQKPEFKTVEIKELISEKPLLSAQQIALLKWVSEYYFCPLHKVLKLFLPKKVINGRFLVKKKNSKKVPTKASETNEQKNISKTLTSEQERVLNEITNSTKNNFLIHGITGSGKTEIYTQLAKYFISQEQQVLIMVPEISLTPQIIDYFEKTLNLKASVIHSKLSEGERILAWKNIWTNQSKLVIGSRSSIFVPFQNLGLIIIDEEHENSYKQDQSPRYNTHKVAEKIQQLHPGTKIVYGSATPSVETAEKLKENTLTISERIGNNPLPLVEIIDLREEFKKGNYSIFSESLQEAMQQALAKKEQIILFLNRRGEASSIVCRDCGYVAKCPNCETSLTYHSKTLQNPGLICHHCGQISTPPNICPACQSTNIRFLGIGTQKIENEILKLIPEVKVLRADKDTTSTKHGFEEIYKKFKNHEADILIGTQMIAKGLHLPKVSLVGVILADIGLNIPDFRTAERNFQLLTQVAGRAGRAGTDGHVIVQTYNPDNIALLCAQTHNYNKFFTYERTQRKLLQNPPFSQIAKLTIENKSLIKSKENAEKLATLLLSITNDPEIFEVHTYPAYLTRLRGKYRHIVLIKYKPAESKSASPSNSTNSDLHDFLAKLPKEYIMDPNIKIDIDPISTN